MPPPYNNIRSKCSRAVCAYLISKGVGGWADTFHFRSRADRAYPNTTVIPVGAKPEVMFTGNYRVTVFISIKGSAADKPDAVSEEAPRLAFEERFASTHDALMQTDDNQTLRLTSEDITAAGRAMAVAVDDSAEAIQFAADNADMADFTLFDWIDGGFGNGEANDEGCDWEDVLIFDAVCCGSAID